jgi:hypothetical protein
MGLSVPAEREDTDKRVPRRTDYMFPKMDDLRWFVFVVLRTAIWDLLDCCDESYGITTIPIPSLNVPDMMLSRGDDARYVS